MKNSLLAGKILRMILLRERNLHIDLITGLYTFKLLLETRNKCARPDLQLLIFRRSALELLVTYKTGVVENYGIIVLNGPFGNNHARISPAKLIYLLVNIFVFNFDIGLIDLYTLIMFRFHSIRPR